MKKLIVPIHSVVDVITNSSTQIYVQFRESSIATIKELIDNILLIGNSDLKSDDLFEFEILDPYLDEKRYEDCTLYCSDEGLINDSMEYTEQELIIQEQLENIEKIPNDEKPDWWFRNEDNEEENYSTSLLCKCKVGINNEKAKLVADTLSKLRSLFYVTAEAQY